LHWCNPGTRVVETVGAPRADEEACRIPYADFGESAARELGDVRLRGSSLHQPLHQSSPKSTANEQQQPHAMDERIGFIYADALQKSHAPMNPHEQVLSALAAWRAGVRSPSAPHPPPIIRARTQRGKGSRFVANRGPLLRPYRNPHSCRLVANRPGRSIPRRRRIARIGAPRDEIDPDPWLRPGLTKNSVRRGCDGLLLESITRRQGRRRNGRAAGPKRVIPPG
jgi:hypothetical protein